MPPLWHQEMLIMMMTGTDGVPSDTGEDLYSCNSAMVCKY